MPTIGEVLSVAAQRRPDAEALIDGDVRLTYAELDARVNQVAQVLAGCGIGHRVVTIDAIPRNASGKILKHKLRERLAAVEV